MLVNVKPIKRNWIYDYDSKEIGQGKRMFIATGQWADGRLAYSMLDKDGNIDPNHDGSFIQVRSHGELLMVRL